MKMTDVLWSKFDESIEELKKSLEKAVFVSIDCEFSGLREIKQRECLFDSNEERYLKLESRIAGFSIVQYGVAAFHYDAATNKYSADVYSIYLFPRAMDIEIKFYKKSLEFLASHGFDFNKMMQEGVSYTNCSQEEYLRAQMAEGTLLSSLRKKTKEQHLVQSQVREWLTTAEDGDVFFVTCPNSVQPFQLHYELRISNNNLWTESTSDIKKIRVVKLSLADRMQRELEEGHTALNEEAIKYLRGFSRVFSMLSSLAVPVVGHNMLLDLMMSFKQFHKDLPAKCDDFKGAVTKLLPSVFDTKFLSSRIKYKLFPRGHGPRLWRKSLPELFQFLKSEEGESIAPDPPSITTSAYSEDSYAPDTHYTGQFLLNGEDASCIDGAKEKDNCADKVKSAHFHDAGWDAFVTGFIFLRLAHINAHQERIDKSRPLPPLTWTDLSTSIEPYQNKIYISFGKSPELNLNGKDDAPRLPPILHVQAKGEDTLNVELLKAILFNYGIVDTRLISSRTALVQCPTFFITRTLLKEMHGCKEFTFKEYNPFRHYMSHVISWLFVVVLCAAVIIGYCAKGR